MWMVYFGKYWGVGAPKTSSQRCQLEIQVESQKPQGQFSDKGETEDLTASMQYPAHEKHQGGTVG